MASRLETLPTELLNVIGVYCDPASLLKLNATCKTIREACNTPAIFSQNLERLLSAFGSTIAFGDHGKDESIFHVDSLARYAVAVFKNRQHEPHQSIEYAWADVQDYILFMPHLRTLGYAPAGTDNQALMLYRRSVAASRQGHKEFAESNQSQSSDHSPEHYSEQSKKLNVAEVTTRLSFCIAIEALNGGTNAQISSGHDIHAESQNGTSISDMMLAELAINQGRMRQWTYLRSHWVIAVLAHNMRQLGREPHPFYRPSVTCPTASGFDIMKWPEKGLPPIPFSDYQTPSTSEGQENLNWDDWLKKRSIELLSNCSESNWEGYYVVRPKYSIYNAPMEDVKMIMFSDSDRYPSQGLYILRATGHDQVGSFTLNGTIDSKSCYCQITKQYLMNGPTWFWKGILTPFGLVGSWHNPRQPIPLGYFWLWRKDWKQ